MIATACPIPYVLYITYARVQCGRSDRSAVKSTRHVVHHIHIHTYNNEHFRKKSTTTLNPPPPNALTLPDPVTNTLFPFRSCKDDTTVVAGRQVVDIVMMTMNNRRYDTTLRKLMVVIASKIANHKTHTVVDDTAEARTVAWEILSLSLLTSRKNSTVSSPLSFLLLLFYKHFHFHFTSRVQHRPSYWRDDPTVVRTEDIVPGWRKTECGIFIAKLSTSRNVILFILVP